MQAMQLQRTAGRASVANRAGRRSVACGAAGAKRILITGGNTGLGYETALELAKQNFEVTIASRNDDASAAAKFKIERAVPGAVIKTEHLDLADFSSVRQVADKLLDQEPFDVLMNNAGVFAAERTLTKDGYELHLGVNYLAPYLLTSLLLPAHIDANKPVRVVNVASAVHTIGNINFDDLQMEKDYNGWLAYGQSKLAMVMWTYQLAKALQNTQVTANAVHPGVCETVLGRNFLSYPTGKGLGNLVADSPIVLPASEGAKVHIHLASSSEVEGQSGKYWNVARPLPHVEAQPSSPLSYKERVAEQLMQVTQQLTGEPLISVRSQSKTTVYEQA